MNPDGRRFDAAVRHGVGDVAALCNHDDVRIATQNRGPGGGWTFARLRFSNGTRGTPTKINERVSDYSKRDVRQARMCLEERLNLWTAIVLEARPCCGYRIDARVVEISGIISQRFDPRRRDRARHTSGRTISSVPLLRNPCDYD